MMFIAYKALYRVYRPQTFGDLVGQEHITKTLKNAVREGRTTHAYLFSGPRGTGKTSAAKILAKAVNCLHPKDGEPCNQCANCMGITSGEMMDVLEIDAASNRGVDEIRDIREKAFLRPSLLKMKVYIIDEVHMLTTEAFNALLKTLEEPPSHVLFILATTDPHKVPLTILSRCQRYEFHKVSARSMMERLREITQKEGIVISEGALRLIVERSDGGMRDALSLLDQVYSFSEQAITEREVHLLIGSLPEDWYLQVFSALVNKQVGQLLSLLEEAFMQGKEANQILRGLLEFFRDLTLFRYAPGSEELDRLRENPLFLRLAESIPLKTLYEGMGFLNRLQNDLRWSSYPHILLETGLIYLGSSLMDEKGEEARASLSNSESIEGIMNQLQQLEEKVRRLENQISHPPTETFHGEESAQKEVRPAPASRMGELSFPFLMKLREKGKEKFLQRMLEIWPEILETIRKRGEIKTEAWLKQGKPVLVTEEEILLSFTSPLHRDMTERPENKKVIEEVLTEKTKIPFKVITVMQDQWEALLREKGPINEKAETPSVVTEAVRLFGEELVEIKNRR